MKLLLHTCCAPCSSAIIETLLREGIVPTIYYCNPNIFPQQEYEHRRNECLRYAEKCGVPMVEAVYSHEMWLQSVGAGLEDEPERGRRCLECFKHRLLASAQYALTHGFDTLSTTLASSRWKNLSQINAAGSWAVETVLAAAARTASLEALSPSSAGGDAVPAPSLVWWDRNWRKGGLQDRRNELIRENCFYNQTYCGCEFSI